HLADGLARGAADVEVSLLATNVHPGGLPADLPYAAWPLDVPASARALLKTLRYVNMPGIGALVRYARATAAYKNGSRREYLANLLSYRVFLDIARPDVIHVQHPLERHLYLREVLRLERWRIPVVVTAHSFFGEHPGAVIHDLMAPNLRSADRVIAVSPHIADQ